MTRLLHKYCEVFPSRNSAVGNNDSAPLVLESGDYIPINVRPYLTSVDDRRLMKEHSDNMLAKDVMALV